MTGNELFSDPDHTALLLVDIQPDFMAGGPLATANGDAILPGVRRIMEARPCGVMVATQDWHPPGHVSFASSHADRTPFETIELHGHEQVLWPDHCVQGTAGAELAPGLPWDHVDLVLRKGCDPRVDSYSGFRNNWNAAGKRPPTGLAGYLRERGVHTVLVCGLARDVCVQWTAEDAAAAGFRVGFLWDLTRPVTHDNDDDCLQALQAANVDVLETADLFH
ncbi:nicotinamidase [Aquisalimonas asiatica]|uniref:nicotinamidase n=1 Tax=Aquisalimonas asiatica TaxID=406100 RepID=A0A1H8UW44_9GAMM|nr:nicotinamidase [Aquisalimonas asiatica]SEP07432.1 nicotinamidase/pyrazinamidase [Aquisalimonas asiatica]